MSTEKLNHLMQNIIPYKNLKFTSSVLAPLIFEPERFNIQEIYNPDEGRYHLMSLYWDFKPDLISDEFKMTMSPLL